MEACRQFEVSEQKGHTLFHPWVASDRATPNCLILFVGLCREALTFLTGRYSVMDGQWYRRETDDGVPAPVENSLEEAWQRAMAVKKHLRHKLGIGAWCVPVAVFTDMVEPDDHIMDELRGRKVRVLWGLDNLVERLLELPNEDDLHRRLNDHFIAQEVAALAQAAPRAADTPEQMTLDLPNGGTVTLQNIGTANIYVTIVVHVHTAGGDPPSLSIQSQ